MTAKERIHRGYLVALFLALGFVGAIYNYGNIKSAYITHKIHGDLAPALAEKNLSWGAPVYLRIFKEEKKVEVWLRGQTEFSLFDTYPICSYSGKLGPKITEGDRQSPEGFYDVSEEQLNPKSSYHLSFNLDFPNEYDRANGRSGSFIMVHGSCVSIGCYAIQDANIEKVYSLMKAAFNAGQAEVQVHVFPFQMTAGNMDKHRESEWRDFWSDLKPAYDSFETDKSRPPLITVQNARYKVNGSH